MLDDVRQGFHRIRRQPAFALAIVAVLTCASSAVAVVLAVAEAVVLRPLPYPDSGRLVIVWEVGKENGNVVEVSHRNYVDWRAQAKSFEGMAAMGSVNWGQRLTGHGEPATVPAAAVSASFFQVLGVRPHVGRVLLEADDQRNAAPVAVISHGFWQRHFGGGPRVLGRQLRLESESFEVVGVMPPEFDFPKGAELWIPVVPQIHDTSSAIETDALEARWFGVLFAVGRLQPDATVDQARTELDALNASIDRIAGIGPPRSIVVTTFEERLLGRTRPALLLLLGAVALIVLTACANVGTLLLMRASRIQAETAVRLSLGAAPRHLFRLWFGEAVVVYALAAAAGLLLASMALPLVVRLAPDSVYRIGNSRLTPAIAVSVAAMMAVAAFATAALITALTAWRLRLAEVLRASGSTAASSRMRAVRRVFVTAEVTVACLLLVAAGLTIRSFIHLRALDVGFIADGVLTLNVSPSREAGPHANRSFYAPLLERINRLPDVIEAGGIFLRPLAFEAIGTDTRALSDRHPVDDLSAWMRFAIPVNRESATPGYFTAMRIPLRDGRYFAESDDEAAPLVAIISESAARRLFPGERAVGRRIAAGGEDPGPDGKLPWRTVVGVVSDVRYRGLQDPRFDYYLPYRQIEDRVQHVVIRARGNPLDAIAQVRREVRRLDPLAVVDGITTMDEIVGRAVAPWRLNMVLFGVLGILALVVASVGVYCIVQYAVVERWHELGIRAALGASMHQLTRLIVAEGAVLGAVGVGIGLLASRSLTHLMATLLFGVTAADPATFIGVSGLLLMLSIAASYVPARIAGRADPSVLLRSR
jgi:predicted permease